MRKPLQIVLILAAVLVLAGWGSGNTEARRDAVRFILEKLQVQRGETWERVGKEFLWTYRFDHQGCELTVIREAAYGDRFTQVIPIGDTTPLWRHDASLTFYCQDTRDCIVRKVESPSIDADEKKVGEAKLLVMNPNDLPKLSDAFAELHRLCDDAYRPPARDAEAPDAFPPPH
jgi:hypothetical protein